MDSRNSSLKSTVLFSAVIVSLGTFNYGFNASSLNIPENYVRYCYDVPPGIVTYYPNSSLPQCIPMSDWIWGLATGFFAIGGLLGSLLANPLTERLGRRDTMLVVNIAFFIGALLLSLSTTSAQFALGRLFVGIGAGGMTVAVSMYIAETTPSRYRGTMGSCLQLFITIGIFIVEIVGLGTSSYIGWRIVVMLTIVPSIIQIICLPMCVRSPRWLITKGRIDEARESLLRLRHGDIEQEFAEMILSSTTTTTTIKMDVASHHHHDMDSHKEDIEKECHQDKEEDDDKDHDSAAGFKNSSSTINVSNDPCQTEISLHIFQIIKIPVLAKLTVKVLLIHIFSQITGINAIMNYSTSIFETTFQENAKYATIGVGALNVLMTLVGSFLIDRLGRKLLLIISSAGMCIFGILEMIGLLYNNGALQVVCVLLFVAFFAMGLGIIPYVYTTEVYPTYAVSGASSAASVFNWLFNFIIVLIFPTLKGHLGPYVFLVFAGIAFISLIYFIFFIPETKQKSIEDIGKAFGWYGLDPTNHTQEHKADLEL
ncbi:unnamed protein product [Cunninghamella echinulata]